MAVWPSLRIAGDRCARRQGTWGLRLPRGDADSARTKLDPHGQGFPFLDWETAKG